MNGPPLIAAVLADAARTLAFERARAASPLQAVGAWLHGARRRWQRARRIGLPAFAGLLAAEASCAQAGLNYPAEDAGQTAPWHLPERFWRLTPAELPPHPVIAPALLAASGPERAGNAAHGLPLLGCAPPLLPPARVAVCLHLFYPELWPLLQAQLRLIPEPWDLWLTVPSFAATTAWHDIVRDQPRVRFMPLPNRGRDVAPWLRLLRSGVLDGYDAVCKLHGKRSPHMRGGDAWRDELLQALLGSGGNIAQILALFRARSELAMLGPAASQRRLVDAAGWAKNRVTVELLRKRLGLAPLGADASFFAGTMFWFRPVAFDHLRRSRLAPEEFPLEMGQTEGTLAHALERLLAASARVQPGSVIGWPIEPSATASQRSASAALDNIELP